VDQTRTTGLVVLPGAFVGAIFGGLSPVDAGVFQILVLVSILASGSIASVITLSIVGPVTVRPRATTR
jgi:putative ABC transport system permease protein